MVVRTRQNGVKRSLSKEEEKELEEMKPQYGSFNEWQLAWYYGVLKKTVVWSLLFLFMFLYGVSQMDAKEVQPFDASEAWRVGLTVVGTVFAWTTLYYDLYRATPPELHDPKKTLLEKNFNGHFSYLTFYIIYTFVLYWTTCLIAEVAWLYGISHHHEYAWARKLLRFTYGSSPLVAALGITLGILFLKFNWFEPQWRKQVLETYHARGHTWFGPTILFTHLNQFPISILDMILIKNRNMLTEHVAELSFLGVLVAGWGIFYVGSTHFNFHLTQTYPYPFLTKILGTTWTLEIAFISGIIIFIMGLTAMMHLIASSTFNIF